MHSTRFRKKAFYVSIKVSMKYDVYYVMLNILPPFKSVGQFCAQLHSQPLRGLLPSISLFGEQRHDMGVNSLHKTVTRSRSRLLAVSLQVT